MDQFLVETNIDDYWNSQIHSTGIEFSLYLTDPAFTKYRNGEVIFARRCFHDVKYMTIYTWATSWESLVMPYANNKSADQPGHPRSLISTFVFAA